MNALGRFFQTEYQRLVSFVRRRIDDAADRDAEDIVQDVMLKMFDSADVSVPFENLAAYVYRSLRNRVIDLLRTRKTTESLSDVLQDTRYDTALDHERAQIRDRVYQAIGQLSDFERAVIIATEFDDRSFRELSEEWRVPMGTLLARKSRALQKIKNELAGQF